MGWKQIQCTCSQCGTGFSLRPSYIRAKNYCSEECKKAESLCYCYYCGRELNIPKSYQRLKNYCSDDCRDKTRRTRTCENCGKVFLMPIYKQRKNYYCSEECADQARKEHKDSKKIKVICKGCGKETLAMKYQSKPYCSEECKNRYKQSKYKQVCEVCGIEYEMKRTEDRNLKHHYCSDDCKALGRLNRTCEYCGKKFYRGKRKKRVYCSVECYEKANSIGVLEKGICRNCGQEFDKVRGRNIFCSNRCGALYYGKIRTQERLEREAEQRQRKEMIETLKRELRELKKAQKELERYKPCKECGKVFKATNGRTHCSEKCKKASQNRAHDRRIRRNGKADYSISLKRLYKRDRGFCQICGKHLEFIEDVQSGDYPSIDHIIPLAKGGLHSWDNVQLACRRCNWEKSDEIQPPSRV